jgi:beta-N-acetylhexosaminidase
VHPPVGVILFARNIQDREQLAALIASLRRTVPDVLLMVDQEGGRVARMRSPHWRAHPPAAAFGRLYERDKRKGLRAAWVGGALVGLDCVDAGFDITAAPVLDRTVPGAHAVIGDRAFAGEPGVVARLGRAFAAGLVAAGIQPVMKHAPGHGRAMVDSHLALPQVDANDLDADLLPFALNTDMPWAMTAHIVYPAWDASLPATLSPAVIGSIIRGRIGFKGVLVTDDIAMQALSGNPAELAVRALAAGCDLACYCSGDAAHNEALLAAVPPLSEAAIARLGAARALVARRRMPLDAAALAHERDRLLA